MFLFKKIASRFLFPVPLSMELLIAGLILLWFTRHQKWGKVLATCGTLLLLVLSNGFVSQSLLHHLEHRYRGLVVAHTAAPSVTYIAVLGGGANDDPDVPLSSHLSPDEMERLIEGVRLYKEMPGTRLILSGGYVCARSLTEVAEALGVKPEDTLRLAEPRDTADESQQISAIVGSQQFVLVTSASHMPRAMGLFKKGECGRFQRRRISLRRGAR